jgi:hypothetical protein
MPLTAEPSDRELVELLGKQDVAVVVSRRSYRYATSSPLEELRVRVRDRDREMIFKDLSRERLIGDAQTTKPPFLYQPAREIETYRRILAPAGVGPELVVAVTQADPPRHWLLVEKVPGVELWQIGDVSVWEAVAVWLGRFHAQFARQLADLSRANPHLLDYSSEWFRSWCARARNVLAASNDRRSRLLDAALQEYDEVAAALGALPPHPVRVCPVDWEMAGIGPGLLDLAALVGGCGVTLCSFADLEPGVQCEY